MATSSGRNRPVAAVSRSSGARCAWSTGRSEQLTRRLGALCLAERDLRDPAHQLRVVPAGDLRHAGQTGVVVQVRIGVYLEHPGPALVVHPEIDAAVALSLHGPPGELGDPNEAVGELLRDAGRAHGCGAEVVGGPELPLAGVGEDGPGALGHATEVDLRDWQHAVPHEADVELAPADVLLDEYFVELLRHGCEARAQRLAVAHDGAAVESRARVLRRLLEQRVRNGLAAARGEGPETRARDGDPREFERSHDMLFPLALPVDALAQIEHEVRPTRHLEPAHVVADGHLADLVAHRGEDRADLVHGFHHAADVLRRPVFGARVEQDDDLHAPTTARCWAGTARRVPASTVSSCPASRRQATRTSSWISSS